MKNTRAEYLIRAMRRGWPLVYVIAVSLAILLLFSRWAYDDPFITYRYARNLSNGLGFVYNPGERVLSTTTPLFTLLLAALGLFWRDLPWLANLLGAASLAIGALFLWDIARSWKALWVGWASLLLYPFFPLLITTLGSETPFYLALCLGAFACYARRRTFLAAILAALAILARPDGALVPVLLAAAYLVRERRPIPRSSLLIFTGIILAWVTFAWIYFGSPLPVTLAAKQQQGAMAISQRFAPGFLTIIRWYTFWPYHVEAVLAVLGIVYAAWRGRIWLLFLAWPVLYFAAYSVLGVSRYFWYYAPLVPGFIAAVGLGLLALGRLLAVAAPFPVACVELSAVSRWRRADVDRPAPLTGKSPMFAAVLLVCLLFSLAVSQGFSLLRLREQVDNRYAIYRAAGEWLQEHTQPEDRIGALEVGIIGYFARRSMVDFAGLIQPAVAAQMGEHTSYEDTALWAVERYRPEVLVLHEGLFPRLEALYTGPRCTLVERFSGERYGYTGNLNVYACR